MQKAYKKNDPKIIEEEEIVENLFDALCASCQIVENQEMFLKSQGIELMLIMIKYIVLSWQQG